MNFSNMNFSGLNNFQQRFLMSFLGIALLTGVIIVSHTSPFQYLFVLFMAISQAAALSEYYFLSTNKGFQPLRALPIAASIIYFFLRYALGQEQIVVPFLFVCTLLTFIGFFAKHENSIVNIAITIFGLLYITIPFSFLIDINFLAGSTWLAYLVITTKMTDTAAYITGKLCGKSLLAPTLSPKKTIEGALAGLIGSTAASFAFFAYFHATGQFETLGLSWTEALLLGASIGLISQIGDLAESVLKRDAKVKDSSTLPGFGGMLDIIDSIIFTAPLLYFWLKAKQIL